MKALGMVAGAVALLFASVAVSTQSLGDLARQESERRKNVKASGKVYTNDSILPDSTSAAPAAPPAAEPPPAKPEAPTAAPAGPKVPPGIAAKGDDPKTEPYWTKRLTAARDSLARAQTFADALQSRINVLSADFVSRDDPAQRSAVGADRQKAVDELARVKAEIAQFQKAITDIQDEARRANVPAGWAR